MEQNAVAVREQQWLETIQTAKKCCLPVNQWCHENGIAGCVFHKEPGDFCGGIAKTFEGNPLQFTADALRAAWRA